MERMGYRNVALVYQKAGEGRLLSRRGDGVWSLDLFPLTVLAYMALKTYDYPKDDAQNPYVPARYYAMGWREIADGLGITRFDSALAEKYGDREMASRRESTAKSRISRAWANLAKRGLIRRLVPASLGDPAGYLLLLGDDEENAKVTSEAMDVLGI